MDRVLASASLMRALTKEALGAITVEAEELKLVLRPSVFAKKSSDCVSALAYLVAVRLTASVLVIHREELWF